MLVDTVASVECETVAPMMVWVGGPTAGLGHDTASGADWVLATGIAGLAVTGGPISTPINVPFWGKSSPVSRAGRQVSVSVTTRGSRRGPKGSTQVWTRLGVPPGSAPWPHATVVLVISPSRIRKTRPARCRAFLR